jgi:hypothetical protein
MFLGTENETQADYFLGDQAYTWTPASIHQNWQISFSVHKHWDRDEYSATLVHYKYCKFNSSAIASFIST